MKLFLIKLMPSEVIRDAVVQQLVRAKDEAAARLLASSGFLGDGGKDAWTDLERSTCEQVKTTGKPDIIMCDFNAG